jgi:hypothetical protein
MAKFSRFDPRNKKQGRNKQKSLYKDIRMHDVEKSRKISGYKMTHVWVDDVATLNEEFEDEDDGI